MEPVPKRSPGGTKSQSLDEIGRQEALQRVKTSSRWMNQDSKRPLSEKNIQPLGKSGGGAGLVLQIAEHRRGQAEAAAHLKDLASGEPGLV